MRRKTVHVNDKMQRGYSYDLVAPPGRNFATDFEPELTPAEMLRHGVFGGKYLTDCRGEFPKSWFAHAKFAPERRDPSLNFFGVNASQPLIRGGRRAGCIRAIRRRPQAVLGNGASSVICMDARASKNWRSPQRSAVPSDHSCRISQSARIGRALLEDVPGTVLVFQGAIVSIIILIPASALSISPRTRSTSDLRNDCNCWSSDPSPSSPSSEFDVSRTMEDWIRSASVSIGAAVSDSALAEANTGAFIRISEEFGWSRCNWARYCELG
jgi:hypothetical protein